MLLPRPASRTTALRCAAAGAEWVIVRLAAANGSKAAIRAALPNAGIDRHPAPKLRKFVTFFSDAIIWRRCRPGSTGCPLPRSERRESGRVASIYIFVISDG